MSELTSQTAAAVSSVPPQPADPSPPLLLDVFDAGHAVWTVYPFPSAITFRKGDRVFVNLHNGVCSGAMDGEAIVISEGLITAEGSKWRGRYKVCFDSDGSTAHVNPNRMVPRFPVAGLCGKRQQQQSAGESKGSEESALVPPRLTVVMVAETLHYREIATSSVLPSDVAVDIGSSAGVATRRLYAKTPRTVGIDISEEYVAKSRRDYPEVRFELMDVLEAPAEAFLEICGGATVVFADIGGDRGFAAMARVVRLVMERLPSLRLLVIKNRAMVQHAVAHMGRQLRTDKWTDKTEWRGPIEVRALPSGEFVDCASTGLWWAGGLVSRPEEWKATWWPAAAGAPVTDEQQNNEEVHEPEATPTA